MVFGRGFINAEFLLRNVGPIMKFPEGMVKMVEEI